MNFLYPGFLFALLAIAIPIVIHLFNFRKFKKVYFSNVQFLKEAKEQNSSREKLKNLLVLLSRILAIVFLVLAFSRPFIASDAGANPALRSVVSIYIDNSYSMETVNKEGSLLDEAKRKAREIVQTYGLNEQFQLLTNDFEGKHQRAVGREEFLRLLDEVKISAAVQSLKQVMVRMEAGQDAGKNQVAYLLSDFQRDFVGTQFVRLRNGTAAGYHLIKLNANSLPNISVDSIWSLSPVHQPGAAEKMVVKLKNYGDEDASAIPVKLTVNGQQKALNTVTVAAGKTVLDTLSFSGLKAGWQKAAVAIKDFPLTFDDELNFSFKVSDELRVLNISGSGQDAASSSYIPALFGADPYFKLSTMPEANIRYAALGGYSLIVLSELQGPSSGLAQELAAYLKNGGSVVIFPDLDAGASLYTSFFTALSLPAVEQLNGGAPLATTIDLKNPVFQDVFEQVPKNMDLPVVSRYFSFIQGRRISRESILQLPLNRALFAKYSIGTGKVYLSASSLDLKDGNLPKHPVFVPLMYKIAFGSVREQPLFYTAGTSEVLETEKLELQGNQSLKLVTRDAELIPEVRQTPAGTLLYVADQVRKPGFYELKKADSVLAVMAFNDTRTESDMHYVSEAELKALFGKQQVSVFNAKKDAHALNIEAKNNSTELWKLCIILSIVFLAIEILLIRFFNHKTIKAT